MNDTALIEILLRLSILTPLLLPGLLLWVLAVRSRRRLRQPIAGVERAVRWGIVGLTGLLIIPGSVGLAAGVTKVFLGARIKAHSAQCLSNVKKLSVALGMYLRDWDETYPPADLWSDGTARYLLPQDPEEVFRCPSATSAYGYAYNPALAEVSLNRIDNPAEVVVLLEYDASARGAVADRGPASVAHRHSYGAIYGFADWGVKWANPTGASQFRWRPSQEPE